jgi:hypothetical protein
MQRQRSSRAAAPATWACNVVQLAHHALYHACHVLRFVVCCCCAACRKTCDRKVDEDLRATIRAFCTGLVSALNKYYAFGSVFAEEV